MVTISGHTLILGWTETTVRVVCQITLLRSAYQKQNHTFMRRVFRWGRVVASTPLAISPIVLLNSQLTKAEMHMAIERGFAERGLSHKRHCIGVDIICRCGDPRQIQDLQIVGAHRASAILLQMNDLDLEEERLQKTFHTTVSNGITLRVLLALRVVLFSADPPPKFDELRVVAQLTSPTKAVEVINLGEASNGRPVLVPQDLSIFLNGLMFNCTVQPGLAYTLLHILGFEGSALRVRKVCTFPDEGRDLVGKTFKELATLFEDAIPAGLIAGGPWQHEIGEDLGLAPTGDRTICAEDRLIFISHNSLPTYAEPGIDHSLQTMPTTSEKRTQRPLHILVCGWRHDWDEPDCFAFRIRDTAEDLPRDSSITFLCMKLSQDGHFKDFMADVCRSSNSGIEESGSAENCWIFEDSVRVFHIAGDAADYVTLDNAIQQQQSSSDQVFHQAILVSTTAHETLSPFSRDTRMLSIMLYLRQLQNKYEEYMQRPMHIIGENSLDSTSLLAMGPVSQIGQAGEDSPASTHVQNPKQPDFVSVHALYARVLTQMLAYPRVGMALMQLFVSRPGTPAVRLEPAADRISSGRHRFGQLVQLVKKLHPDDVLLGIRQGDGHIVIAPMLSEELDCQSDCWLILITRRLTRAQLKEAHSNLPTPIHAQRNNGQMEFTSWA